MFFIYDSNTLFIFLYVVHVQVLCKSFNPLAMSKTCQDS